MTNLDRPVSERRPGRWAVAAQEVVDEDDSPMNAVRKGRALEVMTEVYALGDCYSSGDFSVNTYYVFEVTMMSLLGNPLHW